MKAKWYCILIKAFKAFDPLFVLAKTSFFSLKYDESNRNVFERICIFALHRVERDFESYGFLLAN